MRRLMGIFAAALVMLAAVGCEKNENLPPDSNTAGDVITLSAAINTPATKTQLGIKDGDNYPLNWSEGDAIAVIQGSEIYKFNLKTGSGTTQATFELDNTIEYSSAFNVSGEIKAFYPYSGVTLENGEIKYDVPARQVFVADSFGQGAMPMAAYAADGNSTLQFNNLFGVLKLQLKGNPEGENLQSIEVFSDKAVSGAATLTIDDNLQSIALATTPDVEQKRTVLKKGSGDEIFVSVEEFAPTEILIAMPAAEHEFSVYIITDEGAYYKQVTSAQTFTAGTITKMPLLDLSDFTNKMAYVENGICYGEGVKLPLDLDNDEYLAWAPVNCGYEHADGTYKGYPYGKLYQWGRKDGLGGSTEDDASVPVIDNGTVPETPDPNTFYKNWTATEWSSENNPCPEGWRVPNNTELRSLVYGLNENAQSLGNVWEQNNNLYGSWFYGNIEEKDEASPKIFLPIAGYLYEDGTLYGRSDNEWIGSALYWSVQGYNENESYNLYLYHQNVCNVTLSVDKYTWGGSVRCVKDITLYED